MVISRRQARDWGATALATSALRRGGSISQANAAMPTRLLAGRSALFQLSTTPVRPMSSWLPAGPNS